MLKVKRYLERKISVDIKKGKILIIFGARQVGKTTLVKELLDAPDSLYINGDFIDDQNRLGEPSRAMVDSFRNTKILVIDEAQRIKDIGIKLKVIHDTLPDITIVATGSSSFELSNTINEPLTGRTIERTMFPLSISEIGQEKSINFSEILVYGLYPAVFTASSIEEKKEKIEFIASQYLFKDVLNIEYIKNPKSLEQLLLLLAEQVGSEVSTNELSNTLNIDAKTVEKYLDILEKLFIVFPLHPYYKNKRKSISKKRKYYFYDIGIRNALVGDFTSIVERKDLGALWENFCIVERIKRNAELERKPRYHFWRSYAGEEIDFIEVINQKLYGFECKFAKGIIDPKIQKKYKEELFGEGSVKIVNTDNSMDFFEDKYDK